ncbi:uncharacterized protein VTP21DRAFT_11421 [Calcarisporiella thermophila]|uniref:uncharacterized protein n=1 Tax=Calcarisporiella thermophila TaxID=911321 RepID=UPI0037423DB2
MSSYLPQHHYPSPHSRLQTRTDISSNPPQRQRRRPNSSRNDDNIPLGYTYVPHKGTTNNSGSPPPPPPPHRVEYRPRRQNRSVQFDYNETNQNSPNANTRAQIHRHRSLTRPERQRARVPMIGENPANPIQSYERTASVRRQQRPLVAPTKSPQGNVNSGGNKFTPCRFRPWTWFSWAVTCCVPGFVLRSCGKADPHMQQAWREKVTLCLIILFFCGLLAFLTFALQPALCPQQRVSFSYTEQFPNGTLSKIWREDVIVYGELYGFEDMRNFLALPQIGINLVNDYKGVDLSGLFDGTQGYCQKFDKTSGSASSKNCIVNSPYGGSIQRPAGECIPLEWLTRGPQRLRSLGTLYFEWYNLRPNNLDPTPALMVMNNNILNMSSYLNRNDLYFGPQIHTTIVKNIGRDSTASFAAHGDTKEAMRCLQTRYSVGTLSRDTIGCFASNIIMNVSLAVIVTLIVVRFVMAFLFSWCISPRLVKPAGRHGLHWGSNSSGKHKQQRKSLQRPESMASFYDTYGNGKNKLAKPKVEELETDLYTVMLVTCYSEGESGLRSTFDSLAATTYSEQHKLLFVVCDGLITGSGNERSTPDMVISMLTLEDDMKDPKACSYIAIADGERQLNMAKVYAGHYVYSNVWVPTIVVVKCGTPAEASQPKPGNRGKRDSQVILMSFFQRILFNDRLTELDYELFWKMQWVLGGVTPDKFELVLMVDADTRVAPDSLSHMVSAMANDVTIMGLCGETRIANKKQSWVTMIQVFEYYINHHYAKAFESTFGGVTCLPGCFCMYRIKAPKNGAWVPILANPDILLEYNQNVVTTLHQKNLLLLGEDRFLSTLMLRTFPKRQMMFVPQAVCKTVVPDTFRVLLSQRRRWINSTIHNLMELVLVSDLCGIACLSMQFAVFVELIGTIVLPAAICFTGWLIISSFVTQNPQIIPLLLLAAILGLPAVLIVITTRKIVYVGWMIVYLLALPIWNCVLPTYAYWHFDDFSWGQTRMVAGDSGKDDHGKKEGEFDFSMIVMRKWEEWERERLGLGKKSTPRSLAKMSSNSTIVGDDQGGLMSPERISSPSSLATTTNGSSPDIGPNTVAGGGTIGTVNAASRLSSAAGWIPPASPRNSRAITPNNLYQSGNRTSYYSPRHPTRNSQFPTARPIIPTPSGRMSGLYSISSGSLNNGAGRGERMSAEFTGTMHGECDADDGTSSSYGERSTEVGWSAGKSEAEEVDLR